MMKNVIIKVILTIVVWAAAITARNVYLPLVANQAALAQFQDSTASYTNLATYNAAVGWGTGILVVFTLLMFIPEILKGIKSIKIRN
jgi:hypothetical protein